MTSIGDGRGLGVVGQELARLAARLDTWEAVELARGLTHDYALILDEGGGQQLGGLFAVDAELTVLDETVRGREDIVAFFTRALSPDPSSRRHFITNNKVLEVTGDRVRLSSYFLYTAQGTTSSGIGWGRYDDTIDVSGQRAVFLRRRIEPCVRTDLARGWAGALDPSD